MAREHVRTGRPKGHWPRGKPRNVIDGRRWRLVIAKMRRLLERRHTGNNRRGLPPEKQVSLKAAARAAKCSERFLRRCLAGEMLPNGRVLTRLAVWIDAREI